MTLPPKGEKKKKVEERTFLTGREEHQPEVNKEQGKERGGGDSLFSLAIRKKEKTRFTTLRKN